MLVGKTGPTQAQGEQLPLQPLFCDVIALTLLSYSCRFGIQVITFEACQEATAGTSVGSQVSPV